MPAEELLDQFAVALLSVSTEGRILAWNRGAELLLGYSRAEAIGASLFELIVPERIGDDVAARMWGARPGETITYESVRRHKDGQLLQVEITMGAVSGDGDVVRSLAISMRDVTEANRRRESDRIAEAEELDALVYAVLHDLKAPLRGISGFAAALAEDHSAGLSGEAVDYIERVRRNAERLGTMIEALLSLATVTRAALRPEGIDLAALAREVFARHGVSDRAREVEVVVPAHLYAFGDARLVRTLLDALIDNAWKFTGPIAQARIEIGSRDVVGVETFFVRDNGVGFPMDYASKLFRPFQRVHDTREFPGAGTGLAIARRIVHRHGGRIHVESRVGVGTTVLFTLCVSGRAAP